MAIPLNKTDQAERFARTCIKVSEYLEDGMYNEDMLAAAEEVVRMLEPFYRAKIAKEVEAACTCFTDDLNAINCTHVQLAANIRDGSHNIPPEQE